jgi:hypothetical protein
MEGQSWPWSYGSLLVHMQSVAITTEVVSLNSSHGKVYSIQHYMIKFVSDLRQVCDFLRIVWFPPLLKLTVPSHWLYNIVLYPVHLATLKFNFEIESLSATLYAGPEDLVSLEGGLLAFITVYLVAVYLILLSRVVVSGIWLKFW